MTNHGEMQVNCFVQHVHFSSTFYRASLVNDSRRHSGTFTAAP
jgi:hypothetical protein